MNTLDINELENIIRESNNRNDLWINFIKKYQLKNIVEVGVWKAEFASVILKDCNSINKYFFVDPWAKLPMWNKPFNVQQEKFDAIYEEALQNVSFASEKIVVLRDETKKAVEKIDDKTIDFAYIDGDHTLRGITIDLIKILPKIKDFGFIAGDDFVENILQHGVNFEPTLVYPYSIYFAEAYNLKIIVLPFNQFLIQKIPNGKFEFNNMTKKYQDISVNIGYKYKEQEQKIQEQEQKIQEQEQKIQEQEQKIQEQEKFIANLRSSKVFKIVNRLFKIDGGMSE